MRKFILSVATAAAVFGADIYATFDVEAARTANLSLPVSGIVKELSVDVGSRVSKGQTLLQLDAEDLKKALEAAKAERDLVQEQLSFAKNQLSRYEKIKDAISKDEYERVLFEAKFKEKALAKTKAEIAYKESLIERSVLKAPFGGTISAKYTELGDLVSQNAKTLFTIIDDNSVKLIVKFDQKYWSSIKKGQTFTYKVDGSAQLRSGKISKVYPSADAQSRKATAEVVASGIKPGLFGDGVIKTGE